MNKSQKKLVISPVAAVLLFLAVVITVMGLITLITGGVDGGQINFLLFTANYEFGESVMVTVVGVILLIVAIAMIHSKTKKSD